MVNILFLGLGENYSPQHNSWAGDRKSWYHCEDSNGWERGQGEN